MEDLDIPGASVALNELAHAAFLRGEITFLKDSTGRRIAAIVPHEIAQHALRLRTEAEGIEVRAPTT